MPTYKPFLCNSEVMDVLCYVVEGHTVKSMVKKTKQAQSTVSSKIGFLLKSNIITKDKWKFNPNWKVITKTFQRMVVLYLEEPLLIIKSCYKLSENEKDFEEFEKDNKTMEAIRAVIEDVPNIFNEKRVKRIVEEYADSLLNCHLDKLSLEGLAELYMNTLKRIDTIKFKKFGRDITRIKELFNDIDIRDMEETLFMTVEGELK